MTSRFPPLLALTADACRLGLESGEVIGLRLILAASGKLAAIGEARLMITEKAQAAIDAHFLIADSLLAGEAHRAPERAVALYRRRVQANRRRLTGQPDDLAN